MITPTSEQLKAIIEWRDRNQQMLRENYPGQFIACSSSKLLATGIDYHLVGSKAEMAGEPFLIDWISASPLGARSIADSPLGLNFAPEIVDFNRSPQTSQQSHNNFI